MVDGFCAGWLCWLAVYSVSFAMMDTYAGWLFLLA
jgi:hypothetical protein